VAWEKTDAIEHALDAALTKGNRDSRMGIFKAMQREKVPVRAATLARWLDEETSPETAALLLTALKDDAPADVRPSLKAVVLNPKHSADNRIAALNMLVNDKDADRLAILTTHAKRLEDGPVLAHVLRRLAIQAHQDDAAARVIEPKLKSPDGEVRAAAMWGLGHMSNTRALPHLAAFLSDKDVRVRRAAASAAHLAHDDKEAIKLVVKLGNDPDIETRRACLISLRALHDENCAPLAAAALDTPELTATALMCLRDRGSPKHADAVIALAKRDVRADVLPNAIMALSEWGKQTPSNALTEKMNRAIAEIHGTHGVLVRWRPIGPLTADERIKTIDAFAKKDSSPPHAKLKEHFAFNLGGRVELSRNDDPKTPIWLAYADIAALAPTNVEFLGSSGGSFEVFLNGKSIHRRAKPAKFQPDSDRFAATLEKGVNRVLVQTGDSFAVEFDLRFRRKSSKAEHERLTQAALSRPGNAERGKKVFLDKERAQCIKCHRLADQGERIGPDLTGVGSRFSRIHVIESILEPSRTIAPSFGAWTINLKTGKTLTGVKLAETDMALTIADTQGVQHTIAKTAIDEANPSPISTMPDGLEQRLSADEFVDLVAFLMSQKQTGERR
jgi:putative heme-binding domain-containing protein